MLRLRDFRPSTQTVNLRDEYQDSPQEKDLHLSEGAFGFLLQEDLVSCLHRLVEASKNAVLKSNLWHASKKKKFWEEAHRLADLGQVEELESLLEKSHDLINDPIKLHACLQWAYEQAWFFSLERAFQAAHQGDSSRLKQELQKVGHYQTYYNDHFTAKGYQLKVEESLIKDLYGQVRARQKESLKIYPTS
ncbi:MAG: hypothetical protein KDK66_04280 [Deltaproteobacteria bacterium]|nr:hypothetical protein [Deltaproteobacteria bacterium]